MTNRKSLLFKYFLICTAVILISFICLGAVLLLISSRYFDDRRETVIENNVADISDEISRTMIESPVEWYTLTEKGLNGYSNTAGADIIITDSEGKILLKSAFSEQLRAVDDEEELSEAIISQLGKTPVCFYSDFDGRLEERTLVSGQIFSGNGPSYCIVAIPFTAPEQDYVSIIMRIYVISALIVLVISAVMIYISTVRMTAPIKELSEAAGKVGKANFDLVLPEYQEREFNELAAAFNEMASSLKTYDTMRNSFIANVSHELRTPMTSIGGFVDGMLDGTIPPEEHSAYLKIISSEVHRLSRLVRSMLNLAKIEAGELQPNYTKFSVLTPIVDTLVTFENRLEEKNIEIRGLDTDKRYYLWADSDLIHQVIYNLLENAIKFVNKDGYISFRFEQVGYLTVIYIRNSGEGISQEELSLVFDRFYKSDQSRSMDKTGVGLGLNIVRSIIKLHGGKILVRSVEGEYTEFVFSLPNKDIS